MRGGFALFNFLDYFNKSVMVKLGMNAPITERQFFELEIKHWQASESRIAQITGERYYHGNHDILRRERTAIGKSGTLEVVHNLPNNRIVDNQYAKMVDQKTNYLLGKPFTLKTENKDYEDALKDIFDKKFHRLFQNLGEDCINSGIGWLYVYYDEDRQFCFKRFAPQEVLPFWRDAEHTALECVVRVFDVVIYEGTAAKTIQKVEIYKDTGIERYVLKGGALTEDTDRPSGSYMVIEDAAGSPKPYNWGRIPIIPFKFNDEEIPLIRKIKSLQDAINATISDFQNNMQEDSRNTILVIKNYEGENLADFRHNLAAYGAIKVRTIDGAEGGVDTLQIDVNSENYQILLNLLKKALIENAMGFDAKELKSGAPNQMNIKSMYTDVDLDANGMETEYQASFELLLWFINAHLSNSGEGDFDGEDIEIIFNRDMLMNESDIITDIKNSVGLLSEETLVANHPWVNDLEGELERIAKEKQGQVDAYAGSFPPPGSGPPSDIGGGMMNEQSRLLEAAV